MAFPITPIIDLCNSGICGYCSFQLFSSFRREPLNRSVLYFARGYFALIFSYLFFSIPRLIEPESSLIIGIGFVAAQAFLYIALAFFVRVTTSLVKPRWAPSIFGIVLVVSLIATILSIIFFNYPIYNEATGITDWAIQPVVSVISTMIFVVTLIPSAFLFLWQGIKAVDIIVKTRSLIIGCGLLLLIVTAYTYYTAHTAHAALISDIFSLLSYLVIFVGVIYRRNQSRLLNNQ
jgi:hypothetical protein